MESRTVPDTVQLMVDVAGLCSRAPALETILPAGTAPWPSAQRKDSNHFSRMSSGSTAARVRATRAWVA